MNMADIFETVARTVPEGQALVVRATAGPEVRLTFAELDARANRLAHALASMGIGPGDHVGCHLYDGNQYVEACLAAFKLRADYQAAKGGAFSLREFNERVMTNGIAPWWAHRQLMLPGDAAPALQ